MFFYCFYVDKHSLFGKKNVFVPGVRRCCSPVRKKSDLFPNAPRGFEPLCHIYETPLNISNLYQLNVLLGFNLNLYIYNSKNTLFLTQTHFYPSLQESQTNIHFNYVDLVPKPYSVYVFVLFCYACFTSTFC